MKCKDFSMLDRLLQVTTQVMKHYRAKPLAQSVPKDMHILHCCYKLVDNHLEIVPVCKLKAVKAMGITLLLDL